MEEFVEVPAEISLDGIAVVFENRFRIGKGQRGFVTLDFERKFEDPDLAKLPARWTQCYSFEQAYMIRKHEVVLGELGDQW